jgi:phosphatidylglycerophosphatase A
MRRAILLLATVGFLGYAPVASGTVGSLAAIPLFLYTASLQRLSPALTVAALAAATLIACWIAGRAEEILQEHDSHAIVLDEVVGYLAATLFLAPSWQHALVAFFLFRALDVVKLFPADYIDERFPGGYGVVLDDVVSGIYANVATRVVFLLWAGESFF